jgi:hypothetical protein
MSMSINLSIYAIWELLCWYMLAVSFSSDATLILPSFSVWREEVSGRGFLLALLATSVPLVNVIIWIIALFIWTLESDTADRFLYRKPFSKHKDRRW